MTKDEWTRSLIMKLASGHMSGVYRQNAKAWLDGLPPPDGWVPKAVEAYRKRKAGEGDDE